MNMRQIIVDEKMKELTPHGTPGFPLIIHWDDFAEFKEGFIPWHWHKEIQFSAVLSKHIDFFIEGSVIRLEPGDAILINKNVLHQIRPVQDRTGTMFSLDFDESLIGGESSATIHQKYVRSFTENPALKFVSLKNETSWQKEVASSLLLMYDIYREEAFGYELQLKAVLCSAWHQVVSNIRPQLTATLTERVLDNERVKAAMQFILDNYRNKISLTDIAESIHLSKGECCRCFQRIIKMSPIEFVLQTRIREAAKMLEASDLSISEVAYTAGFNDMSYFGKVFRQHMGCSPSEYRKEALK